VAPADESALHLVEHPVRSVLLLEEYVARDGIFQACFLADTKGEEHAFLVKRGELLSHGIACGVAETRVSQSLVKRGAQYEGVRASRMARMVGAGSG
jgi:hypothetical protein